MNQEIADRMTEMVIKQLENGIVPWRRPWSLAGVMPTSLGSGKQYSGINALILSLCGMEYDRPLWVTYKQAQALGGNVRKGEKSLPVVYWSRILKQVDGETVSKGAFMRTYSVFNVAQCDGITIPAEYDIKREPVATLPALESIIAGYTSKPEIYYKEQGRAFYDQVADTITLPSKDLFTSAEEMAYTLCHEMTHSTGHQSRLNRFTPEDKHVAFGDANYAREELVADIGAQMLLSENGIEYDMQNSASYVAGWLRALKNDTSLIITAAGKGQRAADYIQGKVRQTETVAEEVSA